MTDVLQTVVDDAERIASHLVPDVNKLAPIVGVLIKQVERIAGGELPRLADEVLGIQPPAETPPVPGAGIEQAAQSSPSAGLADQLAEQASTIKRLEAQLARVQQDASEQDKPESGSSGA